MTYFANGKIIFSHKTAGLVDCFWRNPIERVINNAIRKLRHSYTSHHLATFPNKFSITQIPYLATCPIKVLFYGIISGN